MKAVISNYSTDSILMLTVGTDVSRLSCRGESEGRQIPTDSWTDGLSCCPLHWTVYLLKGKRKITSNVCIDEVQGV